MSRPATTALATAADPWQQEAVRLAKVSRAAPDLPPDTPRQSFVIEDPPGYAVDAVLDALPALLRWETPSRATVLMPGRLDGIASWSALAGTILVHAHRAGLPHGIAADVLEAMRRSYGEDALRVEIDTRLTDAIKQHGPLALIIPNIDLVIDGLPVSDRWAFRNVLQNTGLSLIGSASPHWRPGHEEAFYEFFRWTQPKSPTAEHRASLASTLHLSSQAQSTLDRLAARLGGRPALMEIGALALARAPDASLADILRRVAAAQPAQLHIAISALAPQTRQVLAACASLEGPITSSSITAATALPSAAVSAHLTRLVSARLLEPKTRRPRNNEWAFADGVLEILYRALVLDGVSFAQSVDRAQTSTSPPTRQRSRRHVA
ncbi:hypothetical protein [Hyphomicrobium sp. CS1BSMeth3]|uniref:hypothetical protein n=1 Tax=Hyphomicrobium sp. CS1BSMeth3 TaxID=1892844 RepID=UPI0015750472|nr:hypothetical protein [Hyphomicrobium sp. CS1BSMeth3]